MTDLEQYNQAKAAAKIAIQAHLECLRPDLIEPARSQCINSMWAVLWPDSGPTQAWLDAQKVAT